MNAGAPLLHPISAKSPIEWARAEAVALDQHAARMEVSHGPSTKGAPLCRSRAAALRWLVERCDTDWPSVLLAFAHVWERIQPMPEDDERLNGLCDKRDALIQAARANDPARIREAVDAIRKSAYHP